MPIACGGCGSAKLDFGTYEITDGYVQDNRQPLNLTGGTTFVVSPTVDGIALTLPYSLGVSIPPDIPGSDATYRFETYDATILSCEAGGMKECRHTYNGGVVSAPSPGAVHIELCSETVDSGCTAAPVCTDPAPQPALGLPCQVPEVINGHLVSSG